jgi:hypothetical protein
MPAFDPRLATRVDPEAGGAAQAEDKNIKVAIPCDKKEPSSAPGGKAAGDGICGRVRTLVVDVVNPKFKAFNRPLLLAIVAVLVSVGVFAAVFSSIVTDCATSLYVGPTSSTRTASSPASWTCSA